MDDLDVLEILLPHFGKSEHFYAEYKWDFVRLKEMYLLI